ncbi:DUF2087 domain-containing protein [Mesobacterium sp. TK19101]|uniref:DUF2087 domain-containing protein n=1 Tax=Mesobacterium hydrothermale TaxID=3111907 RepID=A0ABU6HDA9_9RHOB|nr:DUF2087 domain-containing protein [Mesobacterium sp. TK19101]MEC3860449.1 DUF2087 domain-containing protein [Mesobacterium sp. TK19101]
MTRDVIPLSVPDISSFAKALRAQLTDPPGHAELLSIVARAAGFRNYQHLKAQTAPRPRADDKLVTRATRCFDGQGRMAMWPARTQVQGLCLWVIWAGLPPRESMTERQISSRIDALTAFRDAAQIRRSLVENRLVTRTRDGAAYERIERAPTPEAAALLTAIKATLV